MTTTRQTRVTYYQPGILFAEQTTTPIDNGPDLIGRAAAVAPSGSFCFALSTVIVHPPIPDGEGGTLDVLPKEVDRSGRCYLGGDLFDTDGVRALDGNHRILLSNMRGNGWARVIRTPFGNFQPFGDNDVLLPDPAKVDA